MLEALGKLGRWDYLTANRWLKHTDKYCRSEDFSVTAYKKDVLRKTRKASDVTPSISSLFPDPGPRGALHYRGVNEENSTEVQESGIEVVYCLWRIFFFFFKHKTWTLCPRSSRRASLGPTCPFLCLLMKSRKSLAEEPQKPTRWRPTWSKHLQGSQSRCWAHTNEHWQ